MKILRYKLLHLSIPARFESFLADFFDAGWQPYGSPYFANDEHYQALVWYEDAGPAQDELPGEGG